MRLALIAVLTLGLAAPALAAEEKKEGKPDASVGQFVDLTPLALPVIANGMVRNYIFLRIRVNLNPGVDATKARDKEPYLRDALIHTAYRTPFTRTDTYTKLDEAKLAASLAQTARDVLGAKAIGQVVITAQDPLHVTNLGRSS